MNKNEKNTKKVTDKQPAKELSKIEKPKIIKKKIKKNITTGIAYVNATFNNITNFLINLLYFTATINFF